MEYEVIFGSLWKKGSRAEREYIAMNEIIPYNYDYFIPTHGASATAVTAAAAAAAVVVLIKIWIRTEYNYFNG